MSLRCCFAVVVVSCCAVLGCGSSAQRIDPADSANCTCSNAQRFNGSECVDDAAFTGPTCTGDGIKVCGCDAVDYESSCDASKAGTQVAFTGACRPPAAPPRGLGW